MRGRLVLLVLAAPLLLGAVAVDLFRIDARQEAANYQVWQALTPADREAAMETWRRFQACPPVERDRLLVRMATLSRLQARALREHGALLDDDELAAELEAVPGRVRERLGLPDADPERLLEELRLRTVRRINAFLANLETAPGRLAPTEAERIRSLPFDERVQAALELQKHEEIYLFSEGQVPSAPEAQAEVVELQALDPLDVLERTGEQRRRAGLLGRGARLLSLSDDEVAELEGVGEDELPRRLKRMMVPKLRELLEQRGVDPDRIDQIVARPYRDLDRQLNRLLLETR